MTNFSKSRSIAIYHLDIFALKAKAISIYSATIGANLIVLRIYGMVGT